MKQLLAITAILLTTATASAEHAPIRGQCDLRFDDDNDNGIGSVEGFCVVEVPRRFAGDTIRFVLRGSDGERHSTRVEVDGHGVAVAEFGHPDTRDWEGRHVTVTVELDGRRRTIFDDRI